MTSCNDYAAMQLRLSVLPSQCLMAMSESPIIHKCIHKENYYSLLFVQCAVRVYCSMLLHLHGLSSYSSSLAMNSRLRLYLSEIVPLLLYDSCEHSG